MPTKEGFGFFRAANKVNARKRRCREWIGVVQIAEVIVSPDGGGTFGPTNVLLATSYQGAR
jgi:hypothetical protein